MPNWFAPVSTSTPLAPTSIAAAVNMPQKNVDLEFIFSRGERDSNFESLLSLSDQIDFQIFQHPVEMRGHYITFVN